MPTFAFRIRVNPLRGILAPTDIDTPIVLANGTELTIQAATSPSRPDRLIMVKRGFESKEAALHAAQTAKAALRAAAVTQDIPILLGDIPGARPASSGWAPEVVAQIRELGGDLVGDVHGIDVYEETELERVRFLLEAEGSVGRSVETFVGELNRRIAVDGPLQDDVAYDTASELYLLTTFETSDRARLLNLVTILEVLAVRTERDVDEQAFVNACLAALASAGLPASSADSLRSALRDLKRISIGASIRALVADVDFTGVGIPGSPEAYVSKCYTMRSDLSHEGRQLNVAALRAHVGLLSRVVQRVLISRL